MKKAISRLLLTLGLSCLAFGQHAPANKASDSGTWTFLQNPISWPNAVTSIGSNTCKSGATACTLPILPTTAGSVGAANIISSNDVTIIACSPGKWKACPANGCFTPRNISGQNEDSIYTLSIPAGTTSITCTFSAPIQFPSSGTGMQFAEFLPPAGSTPSFDGGAAVSVPSCGSCTMAAPKISATDAVIHFFQTNNAMVNPAPPYLVNYIGNVHAVNVGSDTPLGITEAPDGFFLDSAISFKSSYGKFTVSPAVIWSLLNTPTPNYPTAQFTPVSCQPKCSLTIPETGEGHLLVLQAAGPRANQFISSTNVPSGGGNWIVPSGPNSCQLSQTQGSASCAYVLSSRQGAKTIKLRMTEPGRYGFMYYELSKSTGVAMLDAQNSTTNSASKMPHGAALALSGADDACFQEIVSEGGPLALTLYPGPPASNYTTGTPGYTAAYGLLMNTNNGAAPVWLQGSNSVSGVTGICFK